MRGLRQVAAPLPAIVLAAGAALPLFVGCFGAPDSGDAPVGSSPPAPATPAQPPAPSSLAPLYELVPPTEYARLAPPVGEVPTPLTDADFTTEQVRVSAEDKLGELALQIAEELGPDAPVPTLISAQDRARAGGIPFRANPSDVLLADLPEGARLFVALGGDLMMPGNEVAVLDAENAPQLLTRVRVGIRPRSLALHPAGLVFVCSQYSNTLSVIDANRAERLVGEAGPVGVHTEFYCSDLAFVPVDPQRPDADAQLLYVANRWQRSVLLYRIDLVRDAAGTIVDVVQTDAGGAPLTDRPLAEIQGVGASPSRLSLDLPSRSLYVTNRRGGSVVRIDLDQNRVTASFEAGAPSVDLVRIGDRAYVPTLMPDRGLLAPGDADASALLQAAPLMANGLDGQLHVAHPGALLDATRSYGFEDVRNGLYDLDAALGSGAPVYYTDDVSAEPNFAPAQKILAGALPQALVRNAAGDRLYLALGGSDLVQELEVGAGGMLSPGRTFATRERPFALALDEVRGRLYVADWGGDVVEAFDLASLERLAEVDLGYAEPRYPATALEEGERYFYDAEWSNNGRKSCAHCHYDELISDGVGFSNGATAPTALHRVKPNHNLGTTDAYFWNGSFANGSYGSLAFGAQLRTNCEIVLFGLVEGPSSDPAGRVGDPSNRFSDGRDADCRPQAAGQGELPPNFDAGATSIAEVIAAQKALADAHVRESTGHAPDALARRIDLYSASELRLPPNPLRHLRDSGGLSTSERTELDDGESLFRSAGCAGCHDPLDPRQPFANGGERGTGADWTARFAASYAANPLVAEALPGGFPPVFLDAIRTQAPSQDINVHVDPIDFFTPFCFEAGNCLAFEDPLEAGIDAAEESRRLDLLLRFNLADPQRGFVPGNVRGQVKVNVPSLRGVWTQTNLLHHGLAKSVREAILAPGHPALADGEQGFAVDARGNLSTHGPTGSLSPAEVSALVRYVSSIE